MLSHTPRLFGGFRVTKKKAVLVDGASFYNMMRILGVPIPSITVLARILQDEVGKLVIHRSIVFTLSKKPSKSFERKLEYAGFSTIVRNSKTEEDDKFIIDYIKNINPEVIGEIVIVSADGGYINCLTKWVVEEKIIVYWVATKAIDPRSNHPMVGSALSRCFREGFFQFINLADYKERLKGFRDRVALEENKSARV